MLSREELLRGLTARTRDVEVAGLGSVRVQEITVRNRVALLQIVRENLDAIAAYDADQALPADERTGVAPVERLDHSLLTIMHAIVDQNGELMFSMADYPTLQSFGYDATVKLWEAVIELSRDASVEAVDAKKKPLGKTPKSGSPSA